MRDRSQPSQATVQVNRDAEGTRAPTRALYPGGGRAPFRTATLLHSQQTGGLVSQIHLVRSNGDLVVDHVASAPRMDEVGPVIEGCLVLPRAAAAEPPFPVWEKVLIARRMTPSRLLE